MKIEAREARASRLLAGSEGDAEVCKLREFRTRPIRQQERARRAKARKASTSAAAKEAKTV